MNTGFDDFRKRQIAELAIKIYNSHDIFQSVPREYFINSIVETYASTAFSIDDIERSILYSIDNMSSSNNNNNNSNNNNNNNNSSELASMLSDSSDTISNDLDGQSKGNQRSLSNGHNILGNVNDNDGFINKNGLFTLIIMVVILLIVIALIFYVL